MKITIAEYYVKDGYNPSYLYKEINWVKETYNEIKLKMTLNKIEGTLLYMFDKYDNQLIISLSDDINERIKIEFRGEENYLSLSDLCGCLPCKYKLINLTIAINGFVVIQCNQMPNKFFTYSQSKLINKAYPAIEMSDIFQAKIWLVNTPAHGEYYPNSLQLAGCIHEILFNNQTLNMTINGPEITTKCPNKCIKDVCNSGVCYETFGTDPTCDCTNSFLNGPNCNSTEIDVMNSNWEYYPDTVQLRFIKITWRTDYMHIFGIENKNTSLTIQAKGNYLYILYENTMELFHSNKTITDKYQPNQNARLYLSFDTKVTGIKFLQNNCTKITKIFVSKDLSKEHFTSIFVPKRPEFIDFVYKFSKTEYKWTPLRVKFIVRKSVDVSANASMRKEFLRKNVSETDSKSVVKDVFLGIQSSFLLVFLILTFYFAMKFYGKKRGKKILLLNENENSEKLMKKKEFSFQRNESTRTKGSGESIYTSFMFSLNSEKRTLEKDESSSKM